MSNTKIMTTLDIIQAAIRENPGDLVAWAALKDYLLETGTYLPWRWMRYTEDISLYWRVSFLTDSSEGNYGRKKFDIPWKREQYDLRNDYHTVEIINTTSLIWFDATHKRVMNAWWKVCPVLRRVHIRDKEPLQDGRKWYWVMDKDKHPERHCLSQEVLDCMGSSYNGYRSFNTRREAMRALSEAALSWAGKKVGAE